MSTIKWLWSYLKRYPFSIIIMLVLSVVYSISLFAAPIILGNAVDGIMDGKTGEALLTLFAMIIACEVIKGTSIYARNLTGQSISQKVIKKVRNKLYAKLQSLDCSYFDRTSKGDIMSRLTADADSINTIIGEVAPTMLDMIISTVVGFTVLMRTSVLLTVLLLAMVPFVGFYTVKLKNNIKKDFVAMREKNAELNTVVAENISGNRVVKAYAREDFEIEKFEKKNSEYKDAYMGHVYTWAKYNPKLNFFANSVFLIFIVVGGILVIQGKLTAGEFTMFNGSLWCITLPMMAISSSINALQQFNANINKIIQLENEETLIANTVVKKRDTGILGKIQFKNVSFAYGSDRVLRDVNFTVEPGQTLAIIGPTGSGKTTMINLISRFYDPTQGTVYIDDVNLKAIDLATVRRNIASAMQDVFLFSDTIKNNIAYGAPNATYEDVERVAKMADAHDFIMKMSDGYDTMVGERGTGLSGGQRQRISLARALLKNPSILILDDTTSALDMETEFGIQENLKSTLRTKIIIAHRISSVKNADLILVLNHGNVIEWGNHDQLIKLSGYYKSVFDHQFGDFNNVESYHINHPAAMEKLGKGGDAHGN